jgi:hypothetical protein
MLLAVAALAGCPVFPPDNYWNTPVAALPVHARSQQWVDAIGSGDLHPDFGGRYGIPITVTSAKPRATVRFQYASESDRVRYPLTRRTRIEAASDRHAIVVHRPTCRLFETWSTRRTDTGWAAGSGAVWDLRSNRLRPRTWTSADAAGLPILPGLLRWPEVRRGEVRHAIRFTAPTTAPAFIWPARHQAGADRQAPPMGARFRLRTDFDISAFSPTTRVVLRAMQRYGLVLADNGSAWFFQGATHRDWPDRLIAELKTVPGPAFEAVDTGVMMRDPGSAAARP